MRTAKAIWRLYDFGVFLGTFTLYEIMKKTGIHKNSISTYAETGALYKKRFLIEKEGGEQ